jgi:cystathionine beta-synthase
VLVLPDKMSQEKIFNLRAMGAEVVLTRSDVEKGHPEYYQDLGARLAKEHGYYHINQFGNPDNPKAHATTTGPEIFEQMEGKVDAVVVGIGSSGTIAGLTQYFREKLPSVEIILADPEGSVLADQVNRGRYDKAGSWLVEGIGEDFIPEICDFSMCRKAYSISDGESFAVARSILLKEGLLVGSSTGTLVAAAMRYCKEQSTPKRVVTFACDTGNKYLSKLFNDFWMEDQGFIQREQYGDLRDLVGRPHGERATITVGPGDVLTTAHNRLRNAGFSQLPVMEGERLIGFIDEDAILQHAFGKPEKFNDPVRKAMHTNVPVVEPKLAINDLVALLEAQPYAAVMDKGVFHGLITRSDVLNYLRRQMTAQPTH